MLKEILIDIRQYLETIFIVLAILKVAGLITTSWLWVFSPAWIPALVVGIYFFYRVVVHYRKLKLISKSKREHS